MLKAKISNLTLLLSASERDDSYSGWLLAAGDIIIHRVGSRELRRGR